MNPNILQKQSQFQTAIRSSLKAKLFSQRRAELIDNHLFKSFQENYLTRIQTTAVSAIDILHSLRISLEEHPLSQRPALSEATASILLSKS